MAVFGLVIALSGTVGQSFVSRVQAERAQLLVEGAELKQQKAESIRTKAEGDTAAAQQKLTQAVAATAAAEAKRKEAEEDVKRLERARKELEGGIDGLQEQFENYKKALTTKKALPLEDRITFVGRKEPASPEELKASANPDPAVTRRYYMGVKVPTDTPERVTKVTYFMNNPLFPQPVFEGKGETFETYYIGRSCLSSIIVTFVIEDANGNRRSAQRVLNLCAIPEVGDDRR